VIKKNCHSNPLTVSIDRYNVLEPVLKYSRANSRVDVEFKINVTETSSNSGVDIYPDDGHGGDLRNADF
jgi:hypothetical protein